jgi:phospholipid-translocating ATPase
MVFRQCSIGGKVYGGDPVKGTEDQSEVTPNTVSSEPKGGQLPERKSSSADTSTRGGSTDDPAAQANADAPATIPNTLSANARKLSNQTLYHFSDAILDQDLKGAIHTDPNSENAAHARQLNGFFTVLALCHSVLTAVNPVTGAIEYKAQSPDEAALVQAAADMGFVFRGRERDRGEILMLQTPFSDEVEKYELLNILEFTSARKRMSVVLRKMDEEDGRLFLLTKGADNVVFERLKDGEDELKEITSQRLSEFASQGLRTLTLAYKVIPGEFSPY